ncbi:hypothetical protein EDB86DRAFT_3248384 [Lactarius hatsudake]|nr:hypothetical protein EDB86DRAFT_3248384 [Lactarius hatsudake]
MSLQGLRDSDIRELAETSVRSLKRFRQTHREMGGVPSLPPIDNGRGCGWGKPRGFTRTRHYTVVAVTPFSSISPLSGCCRVGVPLPSCLGVGVVNPALAGRRWWSVLVELFSSGRHRQHLLFCCRCTVVVVVVVGRGLRMWLHWWGAGSGRQLRSPEVANPAQASCLDRLGWSRFPQATFPTPLGDFRFCLLRICGFIRGYIRTMTDNHDNHDQNQRPRQPDPPTTPATTTTNHNYNHNHKNDRLNNHDNRRQPLDARNNNRDDDSEHHDNDNATQRLATTTLLTRQLRRRAAGLFIQVVVASY